MKWPGDPEWKKAVEACMAVLEDEAKAFEAAAKEEGLLRSSG
jgi:hypothetical protein